MEEGNMGFFQDVLGEDSRRSARNSCMDFETFETTPLKLVAETSPAEHIRQLEAQQDNREAKVQAVLDTALDWLLFPFESSDDQRDNEVLLDEVDDWFGDNIEDDPSWQEVEQEENGSRWSQLGDDHLSTDVSRDSVDEARDEGHNGVASMPEHGEEEERYRRPLYHLSSSSSLARGESNSSLITTADIPPKRKRGRPKGSGKKKCKPMDVPRGKGSSGLSAQHVSAGFRKAPHQLSPNGSLARGESISTLITAEGIFPKRKRGRPKGSGKNKSSPMHGPQGTGCSGSPVQHVSAGSSAVAGEVSPARSEAPAQKRKRGRPAKCPQGPKCSQLLATASGKESGHTGKEGAGMETAAQRSRGSHMSREESWARAVSDADRWQIPPVRLEVPSVRVKHSRDILFLPGQASGPHLAPASNVHV